MGSDKFLKEKVDRLLKEKSRFGRDKDDRRRSSNGSFRKERDGKFDRNERGFGKDRRSGGFNRDRKDGDFRNDRKPREGFEKKRFDRKPLDTKDRLAKRLAELGVASRRKAEELVTAGRVKINGMKVDQLWTTVDYTDEIEVDGKKLNNKPNATKVYLFNKPSGYLVTTNDPKGRPNVFSLLPDKFKSLFAVGRLDFNTEGLLLFTNNGEAARILELPMTGLRRVYKVRVFGTLNEEQIKQIEEGVTVEGMNYAPARVFVDSKTGSNSWITMILTEGRNREIKKILGSFGLKVTRLIRVQYGIYRLAGVPSGCIVESREQFDMDFYKERLTKNIKEKEENESNEKTKESLKEGLEKIEKEAKDRVDSEVADEETEG